MEVEIKIPITNGQYDKFIKDATERDSLFGKCRRTDIYYSQYETLEERKAHSEPLVRIRKEENYKGEVRNYLTYKVKKTVDGVEDNVERETEISDDISVLEELFDKTNFKVYWTKDKEAVGEHVYVNDNVCLHVEYVKVNGKFIYIEIEVTNDIKHSTEEIIEAIKQYVAKIGLNYEDRDPRGWPEIIKGE